MGKAIFSIQSIIAVKHHSKVKKLNKYKNKDGKIWLNVASSIYVLEDFVNLDNHIFLQIAKFNRLFGWMLPKKYKGLYNEYVEANKKALLVRQDCRKTLALPDNSVDHILCSHFLEHVFPDEMEKITKDFYRVLKKNGTLHVIVPDINEQVKTYIKKRDEGLPAAADDFITDTLLSKQTRGTFKYRLLELSGGFGLQHRWMYNSASMTKKIRDIGFEILDKNETPSKSYRENDDSVHVVARKN